MNTLKKILIAILFLGTTHMHATGLLNAVEDAAHTVVDAAGTVVRGAGNLVGDVLDETGDIIRGERYPRTLVVEETEPGTTPEVESEEEDSDEGE